MQMYKVFVNEKKLTISNSPIEEAKNLHFENLTTFEMAIDLLENTSCQEVNIYDNNIEKIWVDFKKNFKIIEAAGGIVKNNEGNILFIHRLGKWDLPKGKIENGESLEQAAVREVEEETSLKDLIIKGFVNTTYHIYKERGGNKVLKMTHWFIMDYTGNQQPIPQTEEGIIDATWKNKEQILNEVLPTTFRNIDLILRTCLKF